jgi:uncharacterized damage-inducible protein DinB
MFLAKESLLHDINYSAWANRRQLDACSMLTSEEIGRDLGFSHASILATFRHIYDSERVWLDCLRADPANGPWTLPQDPAPEYSFAELKADWPRLWDGYQRWIADVSEDELRTEIIVELPRDIAPSFPRWQILRHAMNHSTLHRGQIVSMIRRLGRQPENVDLIGYFVQSRSK